jgi:hypothetical protein
MPTGDHSSRLKTLPAKNFISSLHVLTNETHAAFSNAVGV